MSAGTLTCVPSMNDLVRQHTALDDSDLEWLHLLVSEWQLLSDLSFADLVLWVPTRDGTRYVSVAQMRPNTGPTSYQDDMVGHLVPRGRRPMLDAALDEGRIVREGDPEWREEVPVRVESIPVRRDGRVLGVIARNTNLLTVRTPSRLELTYLQSASDLAQMIAAGTFPFPAEQVDMDASPRVGDGLIRLDADGLVQYASPNALSAYHRLGLATDIVGQHLGQTTAELAPPGAGARGAGQARQRLGTARDRSRGQRRGDPAPRHPAEPQGQSDRLPGAAPGRHRTPPP